MSRRRARPDQRRRPLGEHFIRNGCSSGKQAFLTLRVARKALRRYNGIGGGVRLDHAYVCDECGYAHLSSQRSVDHATAS